MAVVLIDVKVKPNARRASLVQQGDGSWIAQVKSPPVDGRANEELVALVASHFSCPKSAVTIRRGVAGRKKSLRIEV